jgi:SAM-dependent methyltransferase
VGGAVSDLDAWRWDGRHRRVGTVEAMAPIGLRGRFDLLPPGGCALDVACGLGGVARWLAGRGFAVDAVDVSAVGLGALTGTPGVRAVHHDLDRGLPPSCTGPYDVVVCQRFRDPALYPALVRRLAPGGLLVVTVLSEVDAEPGPFRAPAGELAAAFAGLHVLHHREGGGEAHLVARVRRAGTSRSRGWPPERPAP